MPFARLGDMAHTCDIVPFWPAWTRALDEMIRCVAKARSRCRRCRTLMHVDLEVLRQQLGDAATLINRTAACPVVGCGGTIYYLGAAATGSTYHVLVDAPALIDGVIDPTATPFRSRWHGMMVIEPDSLMPVSKAEVMDLPAKR
jgi:hypothetical protein